MCTDQVSDHGTSRSVLALHDEVYAQQLAAVTTVDCLAGRLGVVAGAAAFTVAVLSGETKATASFLAVVKAVI